MVSVCQLLKGVKVFKVKQIPQELNANSYTLVRLASAHERKLTMLILVEFLVEPSITRSKTASEINHELRRKDPTVRFLKQEDVSEDTREFRKINACTARYALSNEGELYKKGYSMPWLRCLGKKEALYEMEQVYFGIRGDHTGEGCFHISSFGKAIIGPYCKIAWNL